MSFGFIMFRHEDKERETVKYRILKEKEYDKYKYILPNPGRRFWIETENANQDRKCGFINEDGMQDRFGTFCSDTSVWLRPVIEYAPGETRPVVFNEGQAVQLHGLEWTAISEDILVCDRCVEQIKYDDNSNDFENSYLKYTLYQYFRRRISDETLTTEASLSLQKTEEKTSLEKEFSSGFIGNLFCIFIAVVAGVICTLSFSPFSLLVFAGTVVCMAWLLGIYNKKRIVNYLNAHRKNEEISAGSVKTPELLPVSEENLTLNTAGIDDPVISGKADEINRLLLALKKTKNRSAESKVKFFYLPETQKTLELYHSISENGIETPNSKECLDIILENLDKTIKLLTIEYDKAVSDSLLDARMSHGVIGQMLETAENAQKTELKL